MNKILGAIAMTIGMSANAWYYIGSDFIPDGEICKYQSGNYVTTVIVPYGEYCPTSPY